MSQDKVFTELEGDPDYQPVDNTIERQEYFDYDLKRRTIKFKKDIWMVVLILISFFTSFIIQSLLEKWGYPPKITLFEAFVQILPVLTLVMGVGVGATLGRKGN